MSSVTIVQARIS